MSDEKRISDLSETTVVSPDDIFEVSVEVIGGYESRRVKGSNLLPSGVLPSGVVLDHGDQTIDGEKTFLQFPVLPSGMVLPSGVVIPEDAVLPSGWSGGGADIGTIYAINA